jgi:hypothetical protein
MQWLGGIRCGVQRHACISREKKGCLVYWHPPLSQMQKPGLCLVLGGAAAALPGQLLVLPYEATPHPVMPWLYWRCLMVVMVPRVLQGLHFPAIGLRLI